MARAEVFINAPVEDVFELLSDPHAYSAWVVGTREIRAADQEWPARGAEFAHTIGIPPLLIKDRTDLENTILNLAAGPLGHAAIRARNRETLQRLKALAEGSLTIAGIDS